MKDKNVISGIEIFKLTISYLISSIIYLAIPYFNKVLIDFASNPSANISYINIIVIIILTFFIQAFIFYFGNYLSAKYRNKVDKKLKMFLFKSQLDMNKADYNAIDKGMVTNLYISDSSNVAVAILNYKVFIITSILQIVIVLGFMFYVNVKLALISFLFMPLYLLSINLNIKKIADANKKSIVSQDIYINDLKNYINNKADINLTKSETYFEKLYDETLTEWIKNRNNYDFWYILVNRIPIFISIIAPLVILWAGAIAVHQNRLSLGTLVMFSQYTAFLFEPLTNLSQTLTEKKAYKPFFDRLEKFLYYNSDSNYKYEKLFCKLDNFIEIKNTEIYNVKKELLYEANIVIPKKGFYIIKGANGSGKSMLFNIMTGLISSDQLKVKNNGIFKMDESFKSKISILSYPLFFFRATVLDNILLGNSHNSCEIKYFNDIFRLPPLNKKIEIDPLNISSGEGQKICLTRIFIQGFPCVLLDEPTTNLEKDTINALYKHINSEKEKQLIIIITHDNTFDNIADAIFCIENKQLFRKDHDKNMLF
ncbi:ABC transporter transmembrane domain-containing protein [Keratinibaculum paraultunense]|nr:ABC transporter ATP-binding protein [Keratinibaculum paraultunense]QQY79107.1 ABC transporter ATP-binding protein [Keratinibaculum paraultunense]